MERLLDHHVCRPDIAGLMGAYGAALLARSRTPDGAAPTPLTSASLRSLDISAKTLRCKGCGNHCLLTVNRFSNGRKLVSGNRCERGASGGEAAARPCPTCTHGRNAACSDTNRSRRTTPRAGASASPAYSICTSITRSGSRCSRNWATAWSCPRRRARSFSISACRPCPRKRSATPPSSRTGTSPRSCARGSSASFSPACRASAGRAKTPRTATTVRWWPGTRKSSA